MYDIRTRREDWLKIRSVTARVCNAEMRNWVFVRVETDSQASSVGARQR